MRAVMLAALLAAGTACRSIGNGAAVEVSMDPDAPPPIPPGIDAAHLHFTRSRVQLGDVAPDFELPVVDGAAVGGAVAGGGTVALSSLRGRPTVLVFGSFT